MDSVFVPAGFANRVRSAWIAGGTQAINVDHFRERSLQVEPGYRWAEHREDGELKSVTIVLSNQGSGAVPRPRKGSERIMDGLKRAVGWES